MAELRSRLSVGTRIVHYEQSIIEQTTQLESALVQMEADANYAIELSQQLNTAHASSQSSGQTPDVLLLEKLKHIATKINQLQAHMKIKS